MSVTPRFRPFPIWFRVTLAFLGSLVFAAAAGAQPPPREDCSQSESGARLNCKFGNLIVQQQATAEMITFMPEVPASQKEALMKQVERTSRARGRAADGDFKQLTRKGKPSCQVLEIEGDGKGNDDGACEGNNEDCVEIAGDQIGNDDGICHPRQGRNREACVEICDEEAINSDPDNFDDDPTQPSLGADVEEQVDGLTEQYVELNDMLEQDMQLKAAARILTANGDPCAAAFAARSNATLLAVVLGVREGVRGGADILERFCDQTVFGTSSSAFCSIIEGVAAVASLTATTLQFGDEMVDSETIDTTYGCLQSVNTAVGDISASVGESNDALADIQTQLNSLQQMLNQLQLELAEVRLLVNTPLGRREGFPASTTQSSPR